MSGSARPYGAGHSAKHVPGCCLTELICAKESAARLFVCTGVTNFEALRVRNVNVGNRWTICDEKLEPVHVINLRDGSPSTVQWTKTGLCIYLNGKLSAYFASISFNTCKPEHIFSWATRYKACSLAKAAENSYAIHDPYSICIFACSTVCIINASANSVRHGFFMHSLARASVLNKNGSILVCAQARARSLIKSDLDFYVTISTNMTRKQNINLW